MSRSRGIGGGTSDEAFKEQKRFINDQTYRCTSAYKIPTHSIYSGAVVLDCVGLPDEMVPWCV